MTACWPSLITPRMLAAGLKATLVPGVPLSLTLVPLRTMFSGFATIVFHTGQLLCVALTRTEPESRPWMLTHCMFTLTTVVVRLMTLMLLVSGSPWAGNEQMSLPSSDIAEIERLYPVLAATLPITKLFVCALVTLYVPV